MIDVAVAIDGEARDVQRVPVTSAGGTYNAGGKWVATAATPVTISAAIFPANGRQLMDMPEGIRTEAGWIAWSRVDILEGDQIVDGSSRYRVLYRWPRQFEGGFTRVALGLMK